MCVCVYAPPAPSPRLGLTLTPAPSYTGSRRTLPRHPLLRAAPLG